MINIEVNGQPHEVAEAMTLRQLIEAHRLSPDKVAVELNRRLVRSSQYDQALVEGDQVEIVTFVGGG